MAGKFGMKKGRVAHRIPEGKRKMFNLYPNKMVNQEETEIKELTDEEKEKLEKRRKLLFERYGIRE